MITRLILVRHGQTDANAQGRTIATSDPGLNALGVRQAVSLGETLRGVPIDRVLSSPRWRCVQTAQAVLDSQEVRTELELDERLVELEMGAIESLSHAEIERIGLGPVFRAWRQGEPPKYPEGAEDFGHAARRMTEVYNDVVSGPGKTALVVGHSHALRILIATSILGGTPEMHRRMFLGHASVTAVQWEGGIPRLVALNDSSRYWAP